MYEFNYDALNAAQLQAQAQDMTEIASSAGAIIGTVYLAVMVISLLILVISIIGMWKMFKKAGHAGWKSIVPILNTITLLKIAGLSPWLIFVYFASIIPGIGSIVVLIFTIYITYKLAVAFGHGIGYTLGLLFLTPIFYCILGFGKSEYQLQANAE